MRQKDMEVIKLGYPWERNLILCLKIELITKSYNAKLKPENWMETKHGTNFAS